MRSRNKGLSRKRTDAAVWSCADWNVVHGRLVPQGRPRKTAHLFQYVAEKLPFECLKDVRRFLRSKSAGLEGVYLAHDSMGVARNGGRGRIFSRLSQHKTKYPTQLVYFSFYVIANKNHEREIETAILRAAGPQMVLNTRKVRNGIERGNVRDYEAGTHFFERQRPRGRRKSVAGKRSLRAGLRRNSS
jgi:hypothetical protein